MSGYATFKRRGWKRLCWASQLTGHDDRLSGAVERVREKFFSAQIVICLPDGETLAVDVSEHGRRLAISGRAGRVTVPPGVFWRLIDSARKADRRR